jgi:hypothetical protein
VPGLCGTRRALSIGDYEIDESARRILVRPSC